MKKHFRGIAVYIVLLIAIFAIYSFMSYDAAPATISFSELVQQIEDGNVKEIKIIEKEKASIGMLQRWFKIGFNRAARIMDQLADAGVVGEEEGTKPRKVLMSMEEFEQYVDEYV